MMASSDEDNEALSLLLGGEPAKEWTNPAASEKDIKTATEATKRSKPSPDNARVPIKRLWRNNSYLTTYDIIKTNAGNVLEGRELSFNSFSGAITLGTKPLSDIDISRVRCNIEMQHVGGVDKNGNQVGLKSTTNDIMAAFIQIAHENPTNPLLDYLLSLKWDGIPRLSEFAEVTLGAEPSEVNNKMIRKWFISAVARAMNPGCKVDTMLVLVGEQGIKKSTFIETLGAPWHMNSPIDVSNKDAYMAIRGKWICEWPEMETLRRRDSSAVKAFVTIGEDTYREPYGRTSITIARSCVFVGTTNNFKFLVDDSGNRRYWPIKVTQINSEQLAEFRDQLWAEAVACYHAKENWWFEDENEKRLVEAAQEEHLELDPWENDIASWIVSADGEITNSRILGGVIEKPPERRTRSDEMRVGAILRRLGYRPRRMHSGNVWFKP